MHRILVVDDDSELRNLVKTILEKGGFSVEQASSGEEALSRMRESKPDLVLLDVIMPKLSGWGVIKAMEAASEFKNIPVAMLTIKPLTLDTLYSKEIERIIDYIQKPFTKHDLVKKVNEIFSAVAAFDHFREKIKPFLADFEEEYENLKKGETLHVNLKKVLEDELKKAESNEEKKLMSDSIKYEEIVIEMYRKRLDELERLIMKIEKA